MNLPWHTVRLFQVALHLWVLGFILGALPAAEWLWDVPVSPRLPAKFGPLAFISGSSTTGSPQGTVLFVVPLLLLSMWSLFRGPRWWSALIIWVSYTALMDLAWLAGSGGQQLIGNLLFWNIFLSIRPRKKNSAWALGVASTAFWIIRLQLLLAYAVTGIHKLTGTHWLDGTAVGIVSSDPAFGPLWIAELPVLVSFLTWSVLLFQLSFPLAVWWRWTRIPWMLFGILFHLGTAWWMDLPEMGLAFIASYSIWLSDREASTFLERIRSALPSMRAVLKV